MTTINNDDFKVIEKKAPAKKISRDTKVDMTDAERDLLLKAKRQVEEAELGEEATLDVEGATLEHAEKLHDINNAITTLQRNADAQKQLISSVNDKNDKLQDKLNIVDTDSVKVVIPSETLENAINKAILKVNNKLMNSIDEAQEVINELSSEEVEEALKQVSRINDLKNRICDLEDVDTSRLDDLDYDIESEVQNQLDNCYYVEEGEVENMIDDRLDEFVTREDINNDLRIYGREINELRERLNNTLYNKLSRLVKRMFSYNLSNKVRSIFKRNKKEAVSKN